MKINDLRAKSVEELNSNLFELKSQLTQLLFQNKAGNLQDGTEIRRTRRSIAQVLTVINEKKNGGSN